MKIDALISVVMPVYNGEKYLSDAIESVLGQTYKKFEFIIIDDGSSDNSLNIIKHYASADIRIRVISRTNKGLTVTLNEGIALAKGSFIARMDADDVCLPERFFLQLQQLEKSDADLCGCHYFLIDEYGNYTDSAITPLSQTSVAVFLTNTTPFAHGSVMIRRSTLDKLECFYGMTDIKSAEDYALWIELYNRGAKFTNVDEFLYKYRSFSNSLSKLNRKNVKKDAKKLANDFISKNKSIITTRLMEAKEQRLSNREEEILVMAMLKVTISTKKLIMLRQLKLFSKRNLVCGLIRILST